MVSVKRIIRLFPIFALLASLITPFSVATQVAAQESTGSLSISLIDELGNAVPGGCFSIVDSAGTTFPVCDDDSDGTANLAGLAEGDATVEQTSGPDGYTLAEFDTVAIVADEVATLELVSTSIPTPTPTEEVTATEEVPTETATQEPTEEATATEEPTEEATATEEATETATATEEATSPSESTPEDDPGFAAAAEDEHSLQLDCAHSPGLLTTDFRFVFGHLLADPDGPITVVLSPFNNRMEPQPPITINVYDTGETYFGMEWRHVDLVVTWPDDFEATGEIGCNTDRQVININTVSLDSSSNPIPNGGQIPTGITFNDTASLSNATINAGGTATYSLYAGLNCDSAAVSTQTVTVTGGVIPPATAFAPPGDGYYRWRVAYSGDDLNQPVTSSCDSEVVLSGKATPTLTTHVYTGGGIEVPDGGNIFIGGAASDTLELTGTGSSTIGGQAIFNLYPNADCSGQPVYTNQVDVLGTTTGGGVYTPTVIGTYNYQVSYSGDDQNNPVTTVCGSETFNVVKRQTSITTTMRDGSNVVVADGSVVKVGSGLQDTATIAGGTSDAGGTVTFSLYSGANCTGTAVATEAVSGPFAGGTTLPVGPYTFTAEGVYNWQAVYSGDAKNEGSSSQCGTETVTVEKNSPTITSVMVNTTGSATIPNRTLLPIGTGMRDTATMSGASATLSPTGTVT